MQNIAYNCYPFKYLCKEGKNEMSSDRGLASADEETRERVTRKGGDAPHDERGLQAADEETKERVGREGGKASHSGGRND